MPATAANVSFDILLGGKVTPEAIAALNKMEAELKKFGATTKTLNAVMSRSYKEMFDGVAKDGEKAFNKVEHDSREAFRKLAEQGKEAGEKIKSSFEGIKKSYEGLAGLLGKGLKLTGISAAIGTVTGALGGGFALSELTKRGLEAYGGLLERQDVLRAALRGRGREDLTEGYLKAAEELRRTTPVSEEFATAKLTKMAASGKYRSGEEAARTLRSLIALGGGTEAGAEQAISAYARATATGKINVRSLAMIGRGSGFSVLKQMSKDSGIPLSELQAAMSDTTSKKDPMKGAIGSVKAIEMVKKAILELGEGPAAGMIEARMQGWQGLLEQLRKGWDKFSETLGHFWAEVLTPMIREIDTWLKGMDWEATFSKLIEKGREWGQTLVNIYHSLEHTPVVAQIRKIFDDIWKAMTGGIDMYGPVVEAWNDNLNHALGTHFERQLTPAGRKFIEGTTRTIEKILGGIMGAFQWLHDNGETVKNVLWGIAYALVGLKVAEIITDLVNFGNALTSVAGLAKTATVALGAEETLGLCGALGLLGGVVGATVAGINLLLATTSKDPRLQKMAELTATRAGVEESYTAERAAIETKYGGRLFDDATIAEYKKALQDLNDRHAKQLADIDAQIKQATELKNSLDGLDKQVKKTTGNDLVHFDAAIEQATLSLGQLSALNFSGMGMLGGMGGGGVTGAHFTEYGPSVPGDQPGGPTYDWNSYHHIGAWPSVTGPLRAGDVALGYGAQAKYHVSPGQMFTDEYGRTWRFADSSGSKDPFNVDVFRGALGGVVNRPTRALIGESGPEMVLPLTGSLMSKLGHTVNLSFGNISFGGSTGDSVGFIREFAETIASEVKRVLETEHRRSAVV
jgi:hypothetical protein